MSEDRIKIWDIEDGAEKYHSVYFECPGCGSSHLLPIDGDSAKHPIWGFNHDLVKPTLTPSIRARHTDYDDKHIMVQEHVCHSFVTNGQIIFLDDCTHALRGQTVALPILEA